MSLEVSDFFLRQLAENDESAHHVIIWDGAGFHQNEAGSHRLPERILVPQLPAYSPEPNPRRSSFPNTPSRPCLTDTA